MALTATEALWFLPFAVPICIWVAWSDLKTMKIPNMAVLALLVVFLVIGLLAVPIAEFPWRLMYGVIVLAIGFLFNMAGLIGAGDAKFAAVMAPFVPLGDMRLVIVLFAAVLIAAFVTHRLFRVIPAIRARTTDWQSWTKKKEFPMGLALGGTLVFYLALGLQHGA